MLEAVFEGGQFQFVSTTVGLPTGGAATISKPIAFRYEAVIKVIELMVPRERRREVFEKFRWIEPYAVRAAGGSDAKGSDSQAAGQG